MHVQCISVSTRSGSPRIVLHLISQPHIKSLGTRLIIPIVPYSGKLSREKTFTNFMVLWLYTKLFSAKFGAWRPSALQKRAIRESFLCENRIFTHSQKFSPSKVFCFTVQSCHKNTQCCPHKLFYINGVTKEVTRSSYISTALYPSNIEGILGGLPVQHSLVPRPLPDLSQLWRKIGRKPSIIATSQNRPSPDFSPQLQ